jgi:polysaccharide biosynthesis/export protein
MRIALVATFVLSILAGCEPYYRAGEINSFFDPSEPQIRPRNSAPLVKPILDTLDPMIEEPNDQYANATDVQPDDLLPIQGDYTIGKNDLINVSIYDLLGEGTGQTTKTVRVSESGSIALDFIKPVRAEGLTEQQLQDEIRQAYSDAGQIRNARVTVDVAEQAARTYSIYGNVAGVGRYQILENNFRLLDALILAKGLGETQGVDTCYVIRKPPPPPVPVVPAEQTPAPSGPDETTPAPAAPTTQLLQPPQSRGNWRSEPAMMDAASDAAGTQPAPAVIAPDNGASPSGVVAGQPVATSAPATEPGAGAADAGAAPAAGNTPVAETATSSPATQNTSATQAAGAATEPEVATATQPGSSSPGGLAGFKFNAPSGTEQRVIKVPLHDLLNGRLDYNIVIHPGDVIFVPDPVTGEFYMAGHIQRSGPYSLTARKITLKQAIVSAGMFDQAAIPGRSEIIRRIGDNKEVYARVDLFKVFAGEQPDMYLKPNDIVMVGTNAWAPFLAAIRNGFRISYGFGFSYDENYSPQGNNNP